MGYLDQIHQREAAEERTVETPKTEETVTTTTEDKEPPKTEETVTTTTEDKESPKVEETVTTTEETQPKAETEKKPPKDLSGIDTTLLLFKTVPVSYFIS